MDDPAKTQAFMHRQCLIFFNKSNEISTKVKNQIRTIFEILGLNEKNVDIFATDYINKTVKTLLDSTKPIHNKRIIHGKTDPDYISDSFLKMATSVNPELGEQFKRIMNKPALYVSNHATVPNIAKKLNLKSTGEYYLLEYTKALSGLVFFALSYWDYDIILHHDMETKIQDYLIKLTKIFETIKRYGRARKGGKIAGTAHAQPRKHVITILRSMPKISAYDIHYNMDSLIINVKEKYLQKFRVKCPLKDKTIDMIIQDFTNNIC